MAITASPLRSAAARAFMESEGTTLHWIFPPVPRHDMDLLHDVHKRLVHVVPGVGRLRIQGRITAPTAPTAEDQKWAPAMISAVPAAKIQNRGEAEGGPK